MVLRMSFCLRNTILEVGYERYGVLMEYKLEGSHLELRKNMVDMVKFRTLLFLHSFVRLFVSRLLTSQPSLASLLVFRF